MPSPRHTGTETVQPTPRWRTPRGKAAIIRRYTKGGQSIRVIARDFTCGYSTARKILIGAGVQMRPSGWPRRDATTQPAPTKDL